jgi:hypothetical protein
MRPGLLLLAILAGVVLRCALLAAHEVPHGDVLLDTGVARSLLAGEGFRSGLERGTALVRGDGPLPSQDMADQHPPLWPLLGAALGAPSGSPFLGLQLASLLAGLLVLRMTWRLADRLVESVPGHAQHLPAVATTLVALSFLMLEFSADGALYGLQALLVLLLVERLAAARPGVLVPGLLLGAAWLLNHQAAVLLPVPALVLACGAEPGRRARAALAGLASAAVACLVMLPWWWRNALVFGDPFFSTNAFYVLDKAGITPAFSVEGGQPVARFPDVSLVRVLLAGLRAWLPANVLYVTLAGLLLWPGLLGLAASGAPGLLRAAWRGRDRRLLALLACAAAQLVITLAWPYTKLRYLVPLTPLVVLLGVRVWAAAPTRGERRLAWVVAAIWALLLAGTWGDIAGTAADPRPARWIMLAAGGPVLLLLPLLLRHTSPRAVGAGLRTTLVTGLLAVPVLALAALLPAPHTSYNGCALLPDIFGQPQDLLEAREARVLDRARAVALRDGARVACGPETLLAFSEPALVKLPYAGGNFADVPLAALVDAGRCDHVITLTEPPWPIQIASGQAWLDGRLLVLDTVTIEEGGETVAAAIVSRAALR